LQLGITSNLQRFNTREKNELKQGKSQSKGSTFIHGKEKIKLQSRNSRTKTKNFKNIEQIRENLEFIALPWLVEEEFHACHAFSFIDFILPWIGPSFLDHILQWAKPK